MLTLSHAPSDIQEDVMHTIERFVILLYDRTSTCTNIDKARRKLFPKKTSVKQISPTRAALERMYWEQPTREVTYGVSHCQLLYCLYQLVGAGWRQRMVCTNRTGQPYLKLQRPAMSWYHASARRVVWDDANAKRRHFSVQLYVHVKESVHRIDMYCIIVVLANTCLLDANIKFKRHIRVFQYFLEYLLYGAWQCLPCTIL